jgi:hypothetical protein
MRTLLFLHASSGVQKAPSAHAEGLAGDVAGVVGEEHSTGSTTVAAGAGDRCD